MNNSENFIRCCIMIAMIFGVSLVYKSSMIPCYRFVMTRLETEVTFCLKGTVLGSISMSRFVFYPESSCTRTDIVSCRSL